MQAVIHASAQGLQQGRGSSTCPSLPSPILRATLAAGGAGPGDTGGRRELRLVRESPSALSMSGTRCVWSLSREPLCSFAHGLPLLGICGLETRGSQPLAGMPRDPVSAFQPSAPRESSRLWPGLSSGTCKARVWSGAGLLRCRGISGFAHSVEAIPAGPLCSQSGSHLHGNERTDLPSALCHLQMSKDPALWGLPDT